MLKLKTQLSWPAPPNSYLFLIQLFTLLDKCHLSLKWIEIIYALKSLVLYITASRNIGSISFKSASTLYLYYFISSLHIINKTWWQVHFALSSCYYSFFFFHFVWTLNHQNCQFTPQITTFWQCALSIYVLLVRSFEKRCSTILTVNLERGENCQKIVFEVQIYGFDSF